MSFRTRVPIQVCGGRGGNGCVSFHREKYRPRMGPDGGDGGPGGNVYAVCRAELRDLRHLRPQKLYRAGDGAPGQGNRRTGKKGKDRLLPVPPGTRILDASGAFLGELLEDGEQLLLARGGRGGRGNWHFKSATNQRPSRAEEGEPGECRSVVLQWCLPAEVALLGKWGSWKGLLFTGLTGVQPAQETPHGPLPEPRIGLLRSPLGERFRVVDLPPVPDEAWERGRLPEAWLDGSWRARWVLLVDREPREDLRSQLLREATPQERRILFVRPDAEGWHMEDRGALQLNARNPEHLRKLRSLLLQSLSRLRGGTPS